MCLTPQAGVELSCAFGLMAHCAAADRFANVLCLLFIPALYCVVCLFFAGEGDGKLVEAASGALPNETVVRMGTSKE